MAHSLGLAAYLALAGRRAAGKYAPAGQRRDGPLIWGHAANPSEAGALLRLFERLIQTRDEVSFLLTHPGTMTPPSDLPASVAMETIPPESSEAITAFLDHWRPDVCLWTKGDLQPALIAKASSRHVPLYLVNADESALDFRNLRWLPDLVRGTLAAFDAVFARDEAARARLLRLGLPPDMVSVSGPMQEGGVALPCDEATREELATALRGRPVWLAAMVQPDELSIITEAHRAALSFAHRMLLVVVPDRAEDEQGFAAALDDEGWRVARWSRGEMPGETTQVLLADGRDELGLWYRVAPLTLMASSILPGQGGRDPYEPAALGSAVLYGPNVSRYLTAYSRLAAAGAARIVRDAATLQAAVAQLIAPDQAAQMAHAAWEVISDGAEVTDRLLDLVEDTLDVMEDS